MINNALEGAEVGEATGSHNWRSRARTAFALVAVILAIAPACARAAGTSSQDEQDVDKYIDRINKRYGEHIDTAAMLADYDRDMIVSVITVESEGNPRATSFVGARGLMQLMPGTARTLGVKDLSDPFQNILAGTKYLKDLEQNYGFKNTEEALIAYNMGPAKARRFLSQYDSSDHSYVQKVKFVYNHIQDEKRAAQALASNQNAPASAPVKTTGATVASIAGQLLAPMHLAEASTR